jgi:protein AroM
MSAGGIGVVVIGQSPRPDIETELREVLGDRVPIRLVGALDGLSRAEIDRLPPGGSHDALFTNLPDGAGVVISKAEVTKRAQARLDWLAEQGADVTLMNCTGVFEGLVPRGHLIFPSAVLTGLVQGLLPRGRLGVFMPIPEQEAMMKDKWGHGEWEVATLAVRPRPEGAELDAAAREMARRRPELIVLDCMGYSTAMKRRVREVTGLRAVLAISAAARALQELIA